jgi:small-conductance mechanosensitive channel
MDWNTELFGNPLQDWLTALGLALVINVVVGVIKWLIIGRIAKLAANSSTALDDAFVAVARRTKQFLVFGVTLFIGTRYLQLPERIESLLVGFATVAAFLQFGLWAMAGLDFWLERYRKRALQTDSSATTSLAALAFIGRTVLWAIVLLLALDNLGVDVTALVAGLGVGGIAVALAVQNILGDLFASLSIVIDKPFVVGDFIIVDSYMGSVEYVGLKTTRIRSLGGEQIVFSNADLLKARVRNYKRMYERRILFKFGVLYQTTPEQVEKAVRIVREIIEAEELTRFDRAHFASFGDSSLDFEVVYWMKDPDYNRYMDVQQRVNLAMMRAFAKEGIGFAYPTRSLFVEAPVQVSLTPQKAD